MSGPRVTRKRGGTSCGACRNWAKMARLTRYLAAMAEGVAAQQLPPYDGGPVDTAAFEIRRIEKACGLALPFVFRWLGIDKPECRADIDRMAVRLLGMGL